MLPEVVSNTASTDCPTIELFGVKLEKVYSLQSTQKFQMRSLCYIRGV
jgi:hypothetical protein